MELGGAQLVARLPPLPGTVLQAWLTLLGGPDDGDVGPASAVAVLCKLMETGDEQARRVINAPGFTQVGCGLGRICVVQPPGHDGCAVKESKPRHDSI
jgi:hypothetical protein